MAQHSSHYMIAGIKNQYESLKEKYGALEKEYKLLKQTDVVQKIEEYKIYCQALEGENKKLIKNIQILRIKSAEIPPDQSNRE